MGRLLKKREIIVILVEAATLLFVLFLRFKLAPVRYFDIDELAYLHWGYNLSIGERPFSDFLFLLPPLFLYSLMPLFIVIGRSVFLLVAARIFMALVFLLVTIVLVLLGRKMGNIHTGLLAGIVFAFLPIPSDKMLEIRPDMVALLFSLLGLYLFLKGMEKQKKLWLFLAGASFALSLGFIPKTIFFLLPVVLAVWFMGYKGAVKNQFAKTVKNLYLPLTAGFAIPALVMLIVILSFGNFRFALYSMTKLASDIHKTLGAKFYMRPDIFFYPNDTYYGLPGTHNLPYILNLTIYVAASLWAIKKFVSCFSYQDDNKCLREFIIASVFFVNLAAFVKFYPLKHAQYLIMIAPFIALYFADFIVSLGGFHLRSGSPSRFNRDSRNFALADKPASLPSEALREGGSSHPQVRIIFICLYFLLLFSISYASYKMYEKKVKWGNRATLEKINQVLAAVPAKERVFDLTGGSVFFRHGYYFCCLSYGQYEEVLNFPITSIETTFNQNSTKYVYTDFYGRLEILPPLQSAYIKNNFKPYFPDGSLLIRNSSL